MVLGGPLVAREQRLGAGGDDSRELLVGAARRGAPWGEADVVADDIALALVVGAVRDAHVDEGRRPFVESPALRDVLERVDRHGVEVGVARRGRRLLAAGVRGGVEVDDRPGDAALEDVAVGAVEEPVVGDVAAGCGGRVDAAERPVAGGGGEGRVEARRGGAARGVVRSSRSALGDLQVLDVGGAVVGAEADLAAEVEVAVDAVVDGCVVTAPDRPGADLEAGGNLGALGRGGGPPEADLQDDVAGALDLGVGGGVPVRPPGKGAVQAAPGLEEGPLVVDVIGVHAAVAHLVVVVLVAVVDDDRGVVLGEGPAFGGDGEGRLDEEFGGLGVGVLPAVVVVDGEGAVVDCRAQTGGDGADAGRHRRRGEGGVADAAADLDLGDDVGLWAAEDGIDGHAVRDAFVGDADARAVPVPVGLVLGGIEFALDGLVDEVFRGVVDGAPAEGRDPVVEGVLVDAD